MTAPACPACGAHGARIVASRSSFVQRRCTRCGLRFADPMQHPGRDWYESSEIYAEVLWNVQPLHKVRRRWEFECFLAAGFPPQAAVFDVGCGRGDFLAVAREAGYRVCGTDLNRDLVRLAEKHFGLTGLLGKPLHEITRAELPAPPDVVTAFEVLEHVAEPAAFVRTCRGLLAPGGGIFLSTPGGERRPALFDPAVDVPPHHLTLWTADALRRLLESNGFACRTILRKPLLASDLMYHWVRAVPGANRRGPAAKLLRAACKAGALAARPLLSRRAGAGGFTLAAVGTAR
jgi:2-polyprenyl-3-methyl-5-hydroxy-6-metoxy-1,4-benzoquinol methylase